MSFINLPIRDFCPSHFSTGSNESDLEPPFHASLAICLDHLSHGLTSAVMTDLRSDLSELIEYDLDGGYVGSIAELIVRAWREGTNLPHLEDTVPNLLHLVGTPRLIHRVKTTRYLSPHSHPQTPCASSPPDSPKPRVCTRMILCDT
jgi:hypothetical protein